MPCWRVEVRRGDGTTFAPVIGAPDEATARDRAIALATELKVKPKRTLLEIMLNPRGPFGPPIVQRVTLMHDGHRG